MKTKFLTLIWVITLTGCFETNPIMQKDIAEFNIFLQQSEYAAVANVCANYYTQGFRGKVSRTSAICSTFTRDLLTLSQKTGFAPKATLRDFRDKRLWDNWLRLLNVKGQKIDPPTSFILTPDKAT